MAFRRLDRKHTKPLEVASSSWPYIMSGTKIGLHRWIMQRRIWLDRSSAVAYDVFQRQFINARHAMTKPIRFGQFELNLESQPAEASAAPTRETPFRLLVIGDFSGRHNRGVCKASVELAQQPTYSIDPDTFEEVLGRLDVGLRLDLPEGGEARVELAFRELDDFHPDRIFGEAELFGELRGLRRRLLNPATFAEAAAEMSAPAPATPQEHDSIGTDPPSVEDIASTGLLDAMVEETTARGPQRGHNEHHGPWQRLVRSIVEPYMVPAADPRQADLVASVDQATGEAMRRILHHPDLQNLEAAWRGVYFLLRRLVIDRHLQLYLFDASREELLRDVLGNDNLEQSALYKLLVERTIGTAGGEPWSAVVVDTAMGAKVDDAEALGRWAKLARAVRAPVLAGADAALVGCPSLAESPDPDGWNQTLDPGASEAGPHCDNARASYLGLAVPRILLRLPYGPQTVPIDSFAFDELDARAPHASYLWGNGAWAVALVLAQSFEQSGWQFQPGAINTIEGLPLHVFRHQGEAEHKPCAEVLLTDRAATRLHEAGLIPIQSVRERDSVQVNRIRSLSQASPALAGRWM